MLSELEGQKSSILEMRDWLRSTTAPQFRFGRRVKILNRHTSSSWVRSPMLLTRATDIPQATACRVSQLSCADASAMQLARQKSNGFALARSSRHGKNRHIADSVLQKPTRLSDEEMRIVKQHPVIGRRILEGVQGFAPYLAAVELHHENWNGSGYPHGQSGEETQSKRASFMFQMHTMQ